MLALRTRETDTEICGFFGKYRALSNFHLSLFVWNGREWVSGEHAFQASKTHDTTWYDMIHEADSPSSAKKMGRRCPLRHDWEEVKDNIMYEIVQAKFSQDYDLKQLLLSTGDKRLEETNNWGDTYWGVDLEKGGKNKLGEILMKVRTELRDNKDDQ